jgi:hypothetical protein
VRQRSRSSSTKSPIGLRVTGLLGILSIGITLSCGGSTTDTAGQVHATPAALLVVSGDQQVAVAGKALPQAVTARVVDVHGSPVTGQIVNFIVTQGGGSVFAGAAISDGGGIVREVWTMGTAVGPQTLEARAVDSAGNPIVFATFTATAAADAPASISVLTGANQSGLPGTDLPIPIGIRVLDQYGNRAAGMTVQFTTAVGTGAATPAWALTNPSGEATTVWTLGAEIGGPQLSVHSGTAWATVDANSLCPNVAPVLENTGGTCSLAPVLMANVTVTARIPACGPYPEVGAAGGSSPAGGMNFNLIDGFSAYAVLPGCYMPCASYTLAPLDLMVPGILPNIPVATYPLTVAGANGSTIHSTLTVDPGAGTTCRL